MARGLAACVFVAACAALLSTCDNLGVSVEWPTYEIVYHANDGTGDTHSLAVNHGSSHNVLDNMFPGRELGFLGWARTPGGEVYFPFGDGDNDNGEEENGDCENGYIEPCALAAAPRLTGRAGDVLRLYAVWDGFVIVFDANGGHGQPPPMRIPSGGAPESVTLPGISRAGHEFAGWNTCPLGTGDFSEAESEFPLEGRRMNVTLYAIWTPSAGGGNVYFTVFFNANEGEGPPVPPMTGNAGHGITLPGASGLSRDGYVFAGWSTMPCGSGAFFPAGHEGVVFAGNVVLYAAWIPADGDDAPVIPFTVEFDIQGGEGSVPPMAGSAGQGITLPDGAGLSRDGYVFAGWSTRPGGQGVIFPAGYEGVLFAGNVVLFAVWIAEGSFFTITFHPNGGAGLAPSPITVAAGGSATLPNQRQLSMEGMAFAGWNSLPDGSGVTRAAGEEFAPAGDATLYAVWEERSWIQISAQGVITAFRSTGPIQRLAIPPAIGGVTVLGIGERAFASVQPASVAVPQSVAAAYTTFWNARLAEVAIPAGVSFIDAGAFSGSELVAITIPGNVSIDAAPDTMGAHGAAFFEFYNSTGRRAGSYNWVGGRWVFGDDDNNYTPAWYFDFDPDTGTIFGYHGPGGDLVIPSAIDGVPVTAIASGRWQNGVWTDGVFVGRQLTSVVIPGSVIFIGDIAFLYNQLTSVVIPGSVIFIGDWAFSHNQLTSVVIPGSVTYIGWRAFYGNQLTSVVIPDSVTFIGEGAFEWNELTSVVIQYGVTSIGDWAFHDNQLTSVVIPDSVTFIGYSAFERNELTSVVISQGITSIEGWVFLGNQLTSVVIPQGVTSIGVAAFAENLLTSVVIPDSVTFIGDSAFAGNQLTSVVIPDSVTFIGHSAFGRNELTSVVIPNSVTTIGAGAFRYNQLTTVVIPNSVTTIGVGAFRGNQLTTVVIPNSVTTIGAEAFRDNQLTSVVIPDGVTFIADRAFEGNALTSITMPANVNIAPAPNWSPDSHAMGDHGEYFRNYYNSTGRRAGTYTWVGGRWVFGDVPPSGGAGITITFEDLRDMAPGIADIELPGAIGLFDGAPRSITVHDPGGAFESIRWFISGGEITGGAVVNGGATLLLNSSVHENRIGRHRVTVEVMAGGRPYSRVIAFTVVP